VNDQYRETEAGERYARAAFDLAGDAKLLDKVHGDVANLKALLNSSAELRIFVESQVYKSDVKLYGLLGVAK
jgi:F-type H+-transporting ATPase subunit delta